MRKKHLKHVSSGDSNSSNPVVVTTVSSLTRKFSLLSAIETETCLVDNNNYPFIEKDRAKIHALTEIDVNGVCKSPKKKRGRPRKASKALCLDKENMPLYC